VELQAPLARLGDLPGQLELQGQQEFKVLLERQVRPVLRLPLPKLLGKSFIQPMFRMFIKKIRLMPSIQEGAKNPII
jgi:hypothetical protein